MTLKESSLGEHLLHLARALPEGYRLGGILYGTGHGEHQDTAIKLLGAQYDPELAHGPTPHPNTTGPYRDHITLLILGGPEGLQMKETYWEPGMDTTELEIYSQLRADGMPIEQAIQASRSLAQ